MVPNRRREDFGYCERIDGSEGGRDRDGGGSEDVSGVAVEVVREIECAIDIVNVEVVREVELEVGGGAVWVCGCVMRRKRGR